jgi:excisionase family DNA binding protein
MYGKKYDDRNAIFQKLQLHLDQAYQRMYKARLRCLALFGPVKTMVDKIYTIEQAAGILLIKPRTMREWIRQGKVRAFKIGDLVRIHEEDLQEFIDSERRKSLKGRG